MTRIDEAIKNLTPDELDMLNSDPVMLAEFKNKYGEKKASILQTAWEALGIPEKMSREGLGKIAAMLPQSEPTGNLAADIAVNTPSIVAETLAEAAPSFISRGSLLTSGGLRAVKAAAPAIRAVGRGIGKTAEAISGLEYRQPGILAKTFNDPTLIAGPGTKKVGALYEEIIDKAKIRPDFMRSTSNNDLVAQAIKAGDAGDLTPEEALVARRALDKLKKQMPDIAFREMRKAFDDIAKNISKEADPLYARALKSEELRKALPQNKYGGSSVFKSTLGTLAGAPILFSMSPFVQGTAAASAGLAARAVRPFLQQPIQSGIGFGSLANYYNRSRR